MIRDLSIIELSEDSGLLDEAVRYFWTCWGSESNFLFYEDCIKNSVHDRSSLPKFYIALHKGKIIGSYALLVNDLVSRQDLMPWLACLFVDESFRNQGIGSFLLSHALRSADALGFQTVYLSSDLEGFYEKNGWSIFTYAYNPAGEKWKVYAHSVIE